MKNHLLLFIAFFITSISITNAQFNVGQKFISGGLLFNSNNTNYSDTSNNKIISTGINFSIGKFISPLHSVGLGVSYNYYNYSYQFSNTSTDKNNTNTIGVNYFSNFYKPILKNFYAMISWFSSASLILKNDNQNNKNTGFNISSSLSPGVTYKLNKRFLFNATFNNLIELAYSNMNYNNNSIKTSNSLSFSSSLNSGTLGNIGLGFTYLLK